MHAFRTCAILTPAEMNDLCNTVLMLQTPEEVEGFLLDLCSRQELEKLSDRWSIAKLIAMGFSYRIIGQKTGASSSTISRLQNNIVNGSGHLVSICRRREEALARKFAFCNKTLLSRATAEHNCPIDG